MPFFCIEFIQTCNFHPFIVPQNILSKLHHTTWENTEILPPSPKCHNVTTLTSSPCVNKRVHTQRVEGISQQSAVDRAEYSPFHTTEWHFYIDSRQPVSDEVIMWSRVELDYVLRVFPRTRCTGNSSIMNNFRAERRSLRTHEEGIMKAHYEVQTKVKSKPRMGELTQLLTEKRPYEQHVYSIYTL